MLTLGLTGGIGSGKTTVAKIFEALGVPVYNSDTRAKEILFTDATVHAALKNIFGESVFTDNKPDRVKLGKVVFSDKEKLAALNAIIHPLVGKDFEQWKQSQNSKIVLKEAAILIESGAYKTMDQIILVTAPIEERIERVVKRDNTSKEEVLKRIQNQMTEEARQEYADHIIDNSGKVELKPQVEKLIELLS